MKIVVIHGSPRKGNTFQATEVFKKQMNKDKNVLFVDFFLPQDMPEFCCGCMTCFLKGETKCPHAKYTMPIMNEMISADALILTSPTYVLSVSGCMKNFLDHYAYAFVVHRAREEMFHKKAFIICSTVGAGTKNVSKVIETSLKQWGVNRVYKYAFKTFGDDWFNMKTEKRMHFESQIEKKAETFYQEISSKKVHRSYFYTKFMFRLRKLIMRKFDDDKSLDKQYWIQKGWLNGSKRPFLK
jgi:multimeric flavodoxin WrbA